MSFTPDQHIVRKVRVSRTQSVRFQLLTELSFFKDEHLIPTDLEILTLLGLESKPVELKGFCELATRSMYPGNDPAQTDTFAKRMQYVRNRLVKLESRGLVTKARDLRKTVALNPELKIASQGSVLLDYKMLSLA